MNKDDPEKKDMSKRPGHKAPEGYDTSMYEKPSVACDVVILSFSDGKLKMLLIKRKHDPYQDHWAFPGGFVDMDESLEAAAAREVYEETGLTGLGLVPLGAFGDPDRDPRTRVISAAFLALVRQDQLSPVAGDDACDVGWRLFNDPPPLAFDHDKILKQAKERLKEMAVLSGRMFALLPETFNSDLYLDLCHEVMSIDYDEEVFRDCLNRTPCFSSTEDGGYRFDKSKYHDGDLMFLLLGKGDKR